jgi:hypothetical protein
VIAGVSSQNRGVLKVEHERAGPLNNGDLVAVYLTIRTHLGDVFRAVMS